MKKLQINFTTPEQSKRLLELGVPEDSADCYIRLDFNVTESPDIIRYGAIFSEVKKRNKIIDKNFIACWSVGRLIQIRDICAKYRITHADFMGNYIENIIMSFYAIHATNGFDFSKLEE